MTGRDEFENEVLAAVEDHDGKAALLIVPVSDLDVANRRHGREVGDEVLRLVARSMISRVTLVELRTTKAS